MSHRKLKISSLLIFLVAISFSCATLQDMAKTQKPTVSIVDFNLTNFSLQDVELTFDMEVDNPNPFAVTLANYDYDLQFNSLSFIKGEQTTNSSVKANSKSIVQIPVSFGFQELYELFGSLKDKDDTEFTFAANAGVEAPILGLISIPFSKTGTLPVVKLPSIKVGGLKLANLSFTKAEFEIELDIENPNGFNLNFNELSYDLAFNGLPAITGKSSSGIEVAKKSTSSIKLPLSVSLFQLGASAKKAIIDGEAFSYSLTGKTDVGSSLPFFKTSTFNFDRDGVVPILK
ncbi:MAG: LEA type 2 family protein [Balneolaceae bacterium]